ncbi:MAG: YegS/Rv2252/BmrU family lipid kinase [Ruminococcaceae bacterium]|nr:YegS/Rv2252/BmrU family lipid kinase [Oscillospiraceae bacterium]
MKKALLAMNPYAGTRQGVRYLSDVIAIFNRADYEVLAYMTSGQGDAQRYVEAKAGEVDLVVCAGGDGTFNEAVSGILTSKTDVPLGYIPCGSTNDFATSLGLSTNILKAAQEIVEGTPVRYDMGLFGSRHFSYVASFGAFTRASYATPQNVKNALGHMAYILGGISELSQIRKEKIRIELEDRIIEDEFLFGAVSNSTSMGGILTLDPKQVDMRDGKFELLLVRAPKNLTEIGECLQALQTQKYNCAMITFLSTDILTVNANPDMPWTLDGEREDGHARVEIRNLHHAVQLVKKG